MDVLSMVLGIIFLTIVCIALAIYIVNIIMYYNYKGKDNNNGDIHSKRRNKRKK